MQITTGSTAVVWWRDEFWVANGSWITTRQTSRRLAGRSSTTVGR